MALNIEDFLRKIKSQLISTAIPAAILFCIGKTLQSILELPHDFKNSTYLHFLIFSEISFLAAIGYKLYFHRSTILRQLLKIQLHIFLIWLITIIEAIFEWSLCDALSWSMLQKILLLLCQISTTFLISLISQQQFISRIEFVVYELMLGVETIIVSFKTVNFIKLDKQSPNKDIVLLTLTTQIALIIILMDTIQKSYSKHRKYKVHESMNRFENQMVIVNNSYENKHDQLRESSLNK